MKYSNYILSLVFLLTSTNATPGADTGSVGASEGSVNSISQSAASQPNQASDKAGYNPIQYSATPSSNEQATQYQTSYESSKQGVDSNSQISDLQGFVKNLKSTLKTMITNPNTKVNIYSLVYNLNSANLDKFVTADSINQFTTAYKLQQFTPTEINAIISFYNQLMSKDGMFSYFDIINQIITFFGTNDSITQKLASGLLQFSISNPAANAQLSKIIIGLISSIGNDNLKIIAQDIQKFKQQFPNQAKILEVIDSNYQVNSLNIINPYDTQNEEAVSNSNPKYN